MRRTFLVILVALASWNVSASDRYIELEYDNWKIIYNCTKRGYEWFHYETVPDSGEESRVGPFHDESRLPVECRQLTTHSYRLPKDSPIKYHRGHGVHQNIWDHDRNVMKESNSMANIVPQASKLNAYGVWRQTEELTECWRDKGKVTVWGGVIWGRDASNDHFMGSHGVATPDYLWKLILLEDGRVNAWLMPNDNTPTADKVDDYLVSPAKLTGLTGVEFPLEDRLRIRAAEFSITEPEGCSLK